MYTIILFINTFYCVLIGGFLIFNPAVFLATADPVLMLWTRMLGFSFIPMGTLSLLLIFIKSKDVYIVSFTVLSVFHMGMTVAQTLNFLSAYSSLSFVIAHGVLAAVMIFCVVYVTGKHRRS